MPSLPANLVDGSVQQGLSAAGGALGFHPLGLAANKRYSLGLEDGLPLTTDNQARDDHYGGGEEATD